MTKICTKCKVELDESEFSKDKNKKDGLCCSCKKCIKEYNNKNKNIIKEQKKEYYKKNKNKINNRNKNYYIKTKDKNREKSKNYQQERRLKDPSYKLHSNISRIINHDLKKQGLSKKGKSSRKYLPFTSDELKQHLESQFEPWMTWENWGKINSNKRTWNIDHIIPRSAFLYKTLEDEDFRKCWALSNLRPLEAFENIRKGNKIEPK